MAIAIDARKWVCLSLIITAFSVPIAFFSPVYAAIWLMLCAFVYALPYLELASMKREIESEIPIFLRQLGSLIKMGVPFINALNVLSKQGLVVWHISLVVREVERGVSIPKAFSDFAERLGTDSTKRAVAQIISVYEHGGGDELKRLGDELLNAQRHKLKDYAAKSSMVALFFVMFTVVAPTFYIVTTGIGSSFSEALAIQQSVFVLDVLVPLVAMILVILSVAMFPPVVFSRRELSITTLPIAIILAMLFFLPIGQGVRLLLIGLVFVYSLFRFASDYQEKKRLDEIENDLGDALLTASTLPKGAHLKDLFAILSKKTTALAKEFEMANRQLGHNVSVSTVLEDMKNRVNSRLFSKVLEVLEYAFKSGRDVGDRIAELAEDILMFTELKREQISLLSIQKYSLILGLLLVPLILSTTFSIIYRLNVIPLEQLIPLQQSAVPANIVLICSLTATFITTLEGRRSAELIYFSVLTVLSLAIYFNASLSLIL